MPGRLHDTPIQRAFKNPNYRLYFFGQILSLTGTWMQSMAQGWLVYRITGSATWLGAMHFCSQFPAFLVSPLAGVLADRLDRKKILIWVEWFAILQSLALAFVSVYFPNPWAIAVLSVALGLINAFDTITRHSLTIDIVGKDELRGAIALNTVLMNGSRIIGPAIAGIIVTFSGETWCFLINAFSFLAVLFSLYRMRIRTHVPSPTTQNISEQILSGIQYVRSQPFILKHIHASLFVSFVLTAPMALLPLFAGAVLKGDARTLSALSVWHGAGAICGAILAGLKPVARKDLRGSLLNSILMMGFGLLIFGVSESASISFFAMFIIGFYMMGLWPRLNASLQHAISDHGAGDMRGRVMSLYSMTFSGANPIGALLCGWLADVLGGGKGGQLTVLLFGWVAVATALILWNKPGRTRRVSPPERALKAEN